MRTNFRGAKFFVDFVLCLKINPQQIAYLANLTTITCIMLGSC